MANTILLRFKLLLIFIGLYTFSYGQTSCGVDTVSYTYYKTTQFRGVSLNATTSGNAFAQWYAAPQAIVVSGFDFYGWQSDGTNASVSITCNLYRAGSDSLPTGAPLRSVTVNIDSTFGGGQLAVLRKSVVFSSPISITVPYVLTVENTTSTNVSVLANDYAASTPNGRREWLSSVRIAANYLRSYNINVGGISFDADFIFQPHVSYSLTSDFSISECNKGANTITFANTSSPVVESPFYNRYAFYGISQVCYQWNYGDTSGISYSVTGSHSYNYRVAHDVTLYDTIYGWTKGCAHARTRTVFATPDPPKVNNDGPHCSGDSLKLWVDSVPGLTYFWAGPKGFLSNIPNPFIAVSDSSHSGVYYASAASSGCVSPNSNTVVKIHQTPAAPTALPVGSKCVGDSVYFKATSPSPGVNFSWTGPNGFTSFNDIFWFTNLDTNYKGKYIVFAEDAFCKSSFDTTELYIYPPPQPPVLSTQSGVNAFCEGEVVNLVGTTVPGAVLSWAGPDNFISSATKPSVTNVAAANAGFYSAYVIIGSCTSTSDSIEIVVNPNPVAIATALGNTIFCNGDSAKLFTLNQTGSTYQWIHDGVDIPTAQDTIITTKLPGDYKVLVTNQFSCFDTSNVLNVTVKPLPTITQHPITQAVNSGRDVQFSVTSPDAMATFMWQENTGTAFGNIPNAPPYSGVTTNTLTISNTTPLFDNYKYKCLVTLDGCQIESNVADLTINIGIRDIMQGAEVNLYPNPASSMLTIDLKVDKPIEISLTITDVMGRVCIVATPAIIDNSYRKQFDVSQLAKGVYFIKVQSAGEEKTLRFVVN